MDYNELISLTEAEFYNCDDFAKRTLSQQQITVLYIINLCDKKYITESILAPLSINHNATLNNANITGILASLPLTECKTIDQIKEKLLSGNAIIIGGSKNNSYCYAADAKSEDGRSINEPESEAVVRGPRQGFVENAMVNVTLLRKIIKSNKLKVINKTVGNKTTTDIKIVYYEGLTDNKVLEKLLNKISEISIDSCVDSGDIEIKLQSSRFNLFSEFGNSEKPDKVASKILGGRIAIICDGSPVVLTVPYLFTEAMQSSEDYLKSIYYASFIRILRFICLIISMFLPAIYIAVHEFHKGALPYSLYKIQKQTRTDVPFDIFTEMLVVLLVFEIVREVGVRMPKAVGDALSVVGGLILGDAAIKAGLASETVIVIAALTGICNFMNPTFMNANVLLRFVALITAKILGFFGISIVIMLLLSILCKKESFGVSYMTPFAPTNKNILYDTVIMNPYICSSNSKKEYK